MRILGIDPGLSETGWAVLDGAALKFRLFASGLIKTFPSQPLPERLNALYSACACLLKTHQPQALAIEEMFFLKAAHTIRFTLQARGVILLAASQAGCPISEYNPRSVKLALTGSGRADKGQMQSVVQKTLSLAEILRPNDVADAAAIALCHGRSQRAGNLRVLERFGARPSKML